MSVCERPFRHRPAQVPDRSPRRRSGSANARDRLTQMSRDLDRWQIVVRHSDWCGELIGPKNGRIWCVGMTERLRRRAVSGGIFEAVACCAEATMGRSRQGTWSRVRYAASGECLLGRSHPRHVLLTSRDAGCGNAGRSDLVGHQSPAMTLRYSRLMPVALDVTSRLPRDRPASRAVGDSLETCEGEAFGSRSR
jgi:hypothetical protein